MKKLLFVIATALMLTACDNEPVKFKDTADQNIQYHTKNDQVLDGGVREIAPGIFIRKFQLGYDTLYMRCDKDGNPISTDVTVNYRQGKVSRSIGFI